VTFLTSPDHETPTDAGVNNVYNITVHVNDGHGHDVTKDVAITVNDLNDVAPTFTSGGAGSEAENTAASNVVYDANVTDPDTVGTIAYFLTGADASAFNINSGNGQVTFKVSPDHEAPTDAGGNNVYDITVHASDGIHDTTQAVAITVTNVNEAPVAVADHVISNFAGGAYTVPEWALLFNDGDPEGNAIDVNSVTNGSGNMGLSHTAGAGTNGTINIDDNGGGSDGNTFTYTATDGSLVGNSATVTVDNKSAGSNLTGTANDDILVGDSGGSTFTGNGGNDVIIAGGGNDTLIGGTGADVLSGGAGADHFRYNATNEGTDHILDFSAAEGDSIDIMASAFANVPAAGNDATGVFGSSASDTFGSGTERFHYNTATHTLLYDSNGSTSGGTQVALAVLENGSALNAQNIHMV
jgi:Ca2+-binding RTX toxin-like protein